MLPTLPHTMTWYPFVYGQCWVTHQGCGGKMLQCERIDGKIDIKCERYLIPHHSKELRNDRNSRTHLCGVQPWHHGYWNDTGPSWLRTNSPIRLDHSNPY